MTQPTLIKDALDLIDQLQAEYEHNGFKTYDPEDVARAFQPDILSVEEIMQQQRNFLKGLSCEQIGLFKAWLASVGKNGADEVQKTFTDSLTPEQHIVFDRIGNAISAGVSGPTRNECTMLFVPDELFDGPASAKAIEVERVDAELGLDTPHRGEALVEEALARKKILMKGDESNPGYKLVVKPDQIILLGQKDAPPIDFDALRNEITGAITKDLADTSKWEKIGNSYRHPIALKDRKGSLFVVLVATFFEDYPTLKQFMAFTASDGEKIPFARMIENAASGKKVFITLSGPAIQVFHGSLGVDLEGPARGKAGGY